MKKKIFILVVFSLFMISTIAYSTPIAHWNFDETSGSTVSDSIGTYDGTLQNSASFASGGIAGGAINLNRSTSDFVTMGDVLDLSGSSYSIVAWVKSTTIDVDTMIVGKHRATIVSGYLLGLNTGAGGYYGQTNKAWFYNVDNFSPISTTTVNDNTWHQIIGVRNYGGTMGIYVDGLPVEDTAFDNFLGAPPAGTPFTIGGVQWSDLSFIGRYTGLIDDVQVYNHALTDSEIVFLYNNAGKTTSDMTAVPEPATLLLLASGIVGVAAIRRKFKN